MTDDDVVALGDPRLGGHVAQGVAQQLASRCRG